QGRIVSLGPDVEARPGDEVVSGDGLAVVPGLVNGHTHAAMTLFRGYGDDLPLMEWLETRIWPVEALLTANDVYWGTRLACVEMIRSGTVRFWDMYWHPGAVARAVRDAGLRAIVGAPLIDGGDATAAPALREAALRSLDEIAAEGGGAAIPSLAPHAIYTVSEESLRWIAETAAERALPVQIHLSETAGEVERCVAERGVRPAAYLDRVGLLGPRTVLAHGVWLDEAELELVAERGATVVTNPVANMKLGVGAVFPYRVARRHGVNLGLGTDGAGSNNSLDLLADVKAFALIQKHAAGDPAAVTAHEAWEVATGRRSPLIAERGAPPGDETFLLVRGGSPELSLGELEAGLVYAASGSVVDTTVVGGRELLRGGAVAGADEVVAKARERAARLGLATGR
ncbi:MAG TPA: amidohydrolase, partial [Solirubrobacterales bacterium]|nr:amidohydrolase [Solirubrobacterales bacterium]